MIPEDGAVRYLFFAGFRLDCRTGELQRNGRRVKLQAQPARVLVLLASRAGELVTRAETRALPGLEGGAYLVVRTTPRGSRRSRRPSPKRLNPRTVTRIASPGAVESHMWLLR